MGRKPDLDGEIYINRFKPILENEPEIDRKTFLNRAEEIICYYEDRDDSEPHQVKKDRKPYMDLARDVWNEHKRKNK